MSTLEQANDVDQAPRSHVQGESAPAHVATKPAGFSAGKPSVDNGAPTPKKMGAANASVHAAAAHGVSGAAHALPFAEKIQAAFGPAHDVSQIKAHTDEAAAQGAQAMGAQAFASGDRIVFGSSPDLHTVAHEAAHVVQQQAGLQPTGGVGADGDTYEQQADAIADRVVAGQSAADLLPRGGGSPSRTSVQMRRLPTNAGAMLQDPKDAKKNGVNHTANVAGMKRVVQLAKAELAAAEIASIEAAAKTTFKAVLAPAATNEQIIQLTDAIVALRPDFALGDPALIDASPKAGIETASLNDLVKRTNAVFDAASARDKDIGDIFGPTNIAAAKAKYANGKHWLNQLHASASIVTDRSGYNNEVGLGGLTAFQTQIALAPEMMDASTVLGVAIKNLLAANVAVANAPSAATQAAAVAAQAALKSATSDINEATITLLHEALHAGNNSVSDNGYITDQSFSKLPEATKLNNAAHFEVVPRRILNMSFDFKGQVFVPAGTTSASGTVSAPLSASQQSVRDASESIRLAWTLGLNLHNLYDALYKDQTLWTVPQAGGSFADGLPYWSKVEMMTIHQKTIKDPASSDPAAKPVSQIDMAISEGVTRQLVRAMTVINSVPDVDADAATLLASHASAAEIAAANTSAKRRDLWIRFALRSVGPITGDEARDVRVVHELEKGLANWGDILKKRDPNAF